MPTNIKWIALVAVTAMSAGCTSSNKGNGYGGDYDGGDFDGGDFDGGDFEGTGGRRDNGSDDGGHAGSNDSTSSGGTHATGGAGAGGKQDNEEPEAIFSDATKGSPAALSPDGTVAAVCNRDAGTVAILAVKYGSDDEVPELESIGDVALGDGAEPWQVVFSPNGKSAYVILRQSQELVRIDSLDKAPKIGKRMKVGSEPTGLAMSPTGATAYVANWNDGTITAVDTYAWKERKVIDLNPALVATGYLGDVEPRPALAHPRSLAITNDGDYDDEDETLYATEYFGQQVEEVAADGSNVDQLKAGIVYSVDLYSSDVSTISLGALKDIGFQDANGDAAGCFPNQLQDIAIHDGYAYIASVCASPKGPIGAQTNTAPVISMIDLASGKESPYGGQSLNALFFALYEADGVPDDASRRFPLLANDMAFVPGTNVGYITAGGADAVFRFEVSPEDGRIKSVGASTNSFINLSPKGIDPTKAGQRPIGLAISASYKKTALVANDVSRNASLLDFNTQALAGGTKDPRVVNTAKVPESGSEEDAVRRGKRFFTTGVARWSLNGQAWGACESCHADGLTDNVTWHFPRGARQSIAMDGTFASTNPDDQRILNWTSVRDEVHDFELNTRNVSVGVGAGVFALSDPPQNSDRIDLAAVGAANLNGSAEQAMDPENPLGFDDPPLLNDWNEINAYVKTLRTPRRPSQLSAKLIEEGEKIFLNEGSCQGCHSGEKWTVSERFYEPSTEVNQALAETFFFVPDDFPNAILPSKNAENQLLRFGAGNGAIDQIQCVNREVGTFDVAEDGVGVAELRQDMLTVSQGGGDDDGEGSGYNVPSLLGVSTGAPFMHAGGARTLEAMFSAPFDTHTRALAPNLLTETNPAEKQRKLAALVQYLLSIDEYASFPDIPKAGAAGGQICDAADYTAPY